MTHATERRTFWDLTAHDLMTPAPIVVLDVDTIEHAVSVLVKNRISAVAVVDGSGRPTGVLSRADITRKYRPPTAGILPVTDFWQHAHLDVSEEDKRWCPDEPRANEPVSAAMAEDVYSVTPDAGVAAVIRLMRRRGVHRLFVIDRAGALVGVVSAMDVLEALDEEVDPPEER